MHSLLSAKNQQKCSTYANCSKYWLNLPMRLSQNNCFQTFYETFKLLATFVELFAHSSLLALSQQKNNKSYQWNFLKVAAPKCWKELQTASFVESLVHSLLSAESQQKWNV